jgi:hypothetical protein
VIDERSWTPAQQTATPSPSDASEGWTPRPTEAPRLDYGGIDLPKRDGLSMGTDTCGFVSGYKCMRLYSLFFSLFPADPSQRSFTSNMRQRISLLHERRKGGNGLLHGLLRRMHLDHADQLHGLHRLGSRPMRRCRPADALLLGGRAIVLYYALLGACHAWCRLLGARVCDEWRCRDIVGYAADCDGGRCTECCDECWECSGLRDDDCVSRWSS